MCGIFGWLGTPPDNPQALFERLSPLLKHRGPDDEGFKHSDSWGLGFRRLSILDLSELGHQPMHSSDKRYWIIFNGEIYNYVELRSELEKQGERFDSTSDTEVLLRLLMLKGAGALLQLNGMFALAFVDTKTQTFILARDRLGQKPLYYHTRKGHLRFSSELKVLLAWQDAPRELNHQAVVEYLTMSYLSTEMSIFEGYQKLPPGHFMVGNLHEPQKTQPKPYWQLEFGDENGAAEIPNQDLDTLIDLLADSVRIRLRSDVPLGIFLSGGIDSGLIAALAAQNGDPLALTVSFSEDDFDEQAQASATAQHVGLQHRIIQQAQAGLDSIDRLAWFYDEPFGDASALPTMTLSETASAHATVFLSGDGGDEAFGGYQRYIKAKHYAWLGNVPAPFLKIARNASRALDIYSPLRYKLVKSTYADTGVAAVMDGQGIADDSVFGSLLNPNLRSLLDKGLGTVWTHWARHPGRDLLTRQQAFDYALYLPGDILVKADRASTAASIELRSPFLDYRLVEWAAKLPRSVLLNAQQGKLPLRRAAKRFLPEKIGADVKRGFAVPVGKWFRSPGGADFARQRLLSVENAQRGLWDMAGMEKLLQVHAAVSGRDFGEYIWRMLVFDAWARQYLDGTKFLEGAPAQ